MVALIASEDAHFAWMLGPGAEPSFDGLRLPAGGVDVPSVLTLLRQIAADLRAAQFTGMWLIVQSGEVAGLSGFMRPPVTGMVEIGYGIAPPWRRQGLATQAVAAMVALCRQNASIHTVTADTALANLPSQRVLESNGFAVTGQRHDAEDGDLLQWRLAIR